MHKRVQVLDADVVAREDVSERRLGLRILALGTTAVILLAPGLLAVAVNIHVAQLAARHLLVDNACRVEQVSTI